MKRSFPVASLVAGAAAAAFSMMPSPPGQSLTYPATRRDSIVDTYHGTTVADPYRWLEHLESPETLSWVDSQRRVTEAYFARSRTQQIARDRLTALWNYSRTDVPWREAGRLFFTENSGLQRQPVLFVQETAGDAPRVVLDPQDLSPDGAVAVGDFSVSPDGRWLAYSRSRGGADAGETRVRALDSGKDLPDSVSGTLGTVCWTFDGGGFFYARPPAARPGDAARARIEKQLFYHALGRTQNDDRLIGEWKENHRWLYCMLSDDGRRAIVVAERGAHSWMYVLDLGDPLAPDVSAPLVPLLADREAEHTPLGTAGDTLYVLTDLDAPRRRVIALDLAKGSRATARTVIAESSEVIQTATVAGHRLALNYLVDVTSRLRLFTLDGRLVSDVALPGVGAIGWPLSGRHSSPELLYSFRSFLSPSTVYRLDLETGISAPVRPPRLPFDASRYETRQVFYASKDGTRVPMFITARKDLRLDGSHPTLLTGYGGYGAISSPSYAPDVPLWLELGGIYALANIRGGGEYGEEWHLAGSRHRKQTSFDDFIAAAEYLRDQGYTRPARLAIYGHSNGGLLVGALITQRPDLFAAAVPNAGHYDMLRYHRFTVGAGWIPEFGTPDSPEDYRYLRAYSPLHNVRSGTCYPATLLLAADHDDRVVPSHAYKFTAALQAAQTCDRPILLRVARDASHAYASSDAAIAERADMWAFIAEQLGVRMAAAARSVMPELRPIDEAHQQPDFLRFRAQLERIVAEEDVAALLGVVHPQIKNSFGGSDGIEEFRQMWELDRPGSRIWNELREVLRLGGTFQEPDSFVAPYVFSRWPDGVDGFEHVAVIGSDVRIRSSPDPAASVVATVSYAIVPLGGDRGYPQQPWTAVVLPDGQEGFVSSRLVRSPIDYRAFFVRTDGRWQMTMFLAGD